MSRDNFAVFDAEDAPKWHGHEQLYISRFGGPNVTWDVFKCWNGEMPELAAAAKYKAIFITGSHYSAYENLPWLNNLVAWLHDFVIGAPCATKIVAVCFGSQVIARALGGKIGKNSSGRFVLTVENLRLESALSEKVYFKAALKDRGESAEQCQQLRVIESHGDQVFELPQGAELLASSLTASNEIWTYQDRVLAIQGHPEMPSEDALQKIWPFLSSNGRLSEEESAASKAALENVKPDSATIQSMMQAFITSNSEAIPFPGAGQVASGYSSWLPNMPGMPNMTLPSMPGMPAMSLPSVPMPSISLPHLSLPGWVPYASSPAAPEHSATDSNAESSSTAEHAGKQAGPAQQDISMEESGTVASPAAAGAASNVTGKVRQPLGPETEAKHSTSDQSAATGAAYQSSDHSYLPISTHATGTPPSIATDEDEAAGSSLGRFESQPAAQSSSTHAKAEEFLEHVSRAVVAELDGSLCNVQLLFGVNTVARAEFQRILQELIHWRPLVEDMRRKQEECMPVLAELDALEARMDSIESGIKALDQQTCRLVGGS